MGESRLFYENNLKVSISYKLMELIFNNTITHSFIIVNRSSGSLTTNSVDALFCQ